MGKGEKCTDLSPSTSYHQVHSGSCTNGTQWDSMFAKQMDVSGNCKTIRKWDDPTAPTSPDWNVINISTGGRDWQQQNGNLMKYTRLIGRGSYCKELKADGEKCEADAECTSNFCWPYDYNSTHDPIKVCKARQAQHSCCKVGWVPVEVGLRSIS